MIHDDALVTRQKFAADFHRPQYHYLPPSNWMNDPNGVIQWGNQYHLFYQYNPFGADHANMHWGHAVSDDLIHWQDLPVAIAPTPDSVDEGGIFSGCIVNHDGVPTMFYTGVNAGNTIQTQCLATGDESLTEWQKHPQNPVIDKLPPSVHQTNDFRDPFVWQEDEMWYMAVGSRIEGVGGAILLYQSSDLVNWDYLHPLYVGAMATSGVMWECPNFFPLGDKWVLIISSHTLYETGTVLYFVGDYVDHRFVPEREGVLDPGYYYAPLTHLDNEGRRLMYAWIREGRSTGQQVNAGWSGVQAIPRVLSLDYQNRLVMQPIEELQSIRGTHHQFTKDDLSKDRIPITGLSLEIHISFDLSQTQACGIALGVSPDGQEQTRLLYDTETHILRLHRQYAQADDDLETDWQGTPHYLDDGETLDLIILLDGSVLEIIANGRTGLTSRIYSQNLQNHHIHLIDVDSVQSLDIWEMPSIWSS